MKCNWCQYSPLANPNLINTKPDAICPYCSTWRKSGDNVRDVLCKWEGLENINVDRQFIISQLRHQIFDLN